MVTNDATFNSYSELAEQYKLKNRVPFTQPENGRKCVVKHRLMHPVDKHPIYIIKSLYKTKKRKEYIIDERGLMLISEIEKLNLTSPPTRDRPTPITITAEMVDYIERRRIENENKFTNFDHLREFLLKDLRARYGK